MRRIFALLFCLSLLPVNVRAAEGKYVALTFDDGPSGSIPASCWTGSATGEPKPPSCSAATGSRTTRTLPSGSSTKVMRSASTAIPTRA